MNQLAYSVGLKPVYPEDSAITVETGISPQVEDLLRFHLQSAERLLGSTVAVAESLKLQTWKLFDQLDQILPILVARRHWELQRYSLGEYGFALAASPDHDPIDQALPTHSLIIHPRAMLQEVLTLTNDYLTQEQLSLRHAWLIGNQPPGLGHILQEHAHRLRQDAWFLQSAYARAHHRYVGNSDCS